VRRPATFNRYRLVLLPPLGGGRLLLRLLLTSRCCRVLFLRNHGAPLLLHRGFRRGSLLLALAGWRPGRRRGGTNPRAHSRGSGRLGRLRDLDGGGLGNGLVGRRLRGLELALHGLENLRLLLGRALQTPMRPLKEKE
jgi:hypothetical protein